MHREELPERSQVLIADIAQRLRDVCAAYDAQQFDQLVAEIVRIRLKYEQRFGSDSGDLTFDVPKGVRGSPEDNGAPHGDS
jgi:hypothetical protein